MLSPWMVRFSSPLVSWLTALTADPELARRAQRLALWSLDEEKNKPAVIAALQLAINPYIATENVVQSLTFRGTITAG